MIVANIGLSLSFVSLNDTWFQQGCSVPCRTILFPMLANH